MKRPLLNLSVIVLGFFTSATLDHLPNWLTIIRMQRMDFYYLRWVNVILDIFFAVIVLFILWWSTIKNKPDRVLSILFVVIGLILLVLGSMVIYALPAKILNLVHLPGLFMQFYFLTCAPNNIYFLSYSSLMVWIGLIGLVKLKPYTVENPLSFLTVAAGLILSYGVDLVHQFASKQVNLINMKFLMVVPVENFLFALIIIVVAWWLLILNKPAKSTLAFSLILGIGVLLYKSPLFFNFPVILTPHWYARQQTLSICSPYSFTVTYGGFIVVIALAGFYRSRFNSLKSTSGAD